MKCAIQNSGSTNRPQICETYWYESKNEPMWKMCGILWRQFWVNLTVEEGHENQRQKRIQIHRAAGKEDKTSIISWCLVFAINIFVCKWSNVDRCYIT